MEKRQETVVFTYTDAECNEDELKLVIDDLGDAKSMYDADAYILLPYFKESQTLRELITALDRFYEGRLLQGIDTANIPDVNFEDHSEIDVMYIDCLGAEGVYYYYPYDQTLDYEKMLGHPGADEEDYMSDIEYKDVADSDIYEDASFQNELSDYSERMDELYPALKEYYKKHIFEEFPDELKDDLKYAEAKWEPELPPPIFYLVSYMRWVLDYKTPKVEEILKSIGATDEDISEIFSGPTDLYF